MSTPQEERIFSGLLFCPGDPELRAMKLKSHNLCQEYNQTWEEETEKRAALLLEILGSFGGGTMQGPIFFHYGKHTTIGKRFFANYDLTVQDDGLVTIGDDCNFGPKVTIVTPVHPMVAEERFLVNGPDGNPLRVCWAKPSVLESPSETDVLSGQGRWSLGISRPTLLPLAIPVGSFGRLQTATASSPIRRFWADARL